MPGNIEAWCTVVSLLYDKINKFLQARVSVPLNMVKLLRQYLKVLENRLTSLAFKEIEAALKAVANLSKLATFNNLLDFKFLNALKGCPLISSGALGAVDNMLKEIENSKISKFSQLPADFLSNLENLIKGSLSAALDSVANLYPSAMIGKIVSVIDQFMSTSGIFAAFDLLDTLGICIKSACKVAKGIDGKVTQVSKALGISSKTKRFDYMALTDYDGDTSISKQFMKDTSVIVANYTKASTDINNFTLKVVDEGKDILIVTPKKEFKSITNDIKNAINL